MDLGDRRLRFCVLGRSGEAIEEGSLRSQFSSMLGIPEVPQPQDGLYRVEVNEKGKVAAVTILRGISRNADNFVMTQLVAWYAKPGPVRVVDVPVIYATTPKPIDPFTSRRTGLPPGGRAPRS